MGALGDGLISGLILAIFFGIMTVIASRRKVEDALREKPTDLKRLNTPLGIEAVFDTLQQYAQHHKFMIEDFNPTTGRIVLGRNPNSYQNGVWVPIYLTRQPNGSTLVEIGIKSKMFQARFAMNLIRNRVVKELRELLRAHEGQ